MPEPAHSIPPHPSHRRVHVRGSGPVAQAIVHVLQGDGWSLAPDPDRAGWLVHVTDGRETEATPLLADLRAFAAPRDGTDAPDRRGIVLVLDLAHAQSRAGETPPPFAEALALRSLQAALPLLALEFAPRLRINAIGILGPCAQLPQGTPHADIAAALRFVIDAPALTGQMIALDGGRTALVPAPGLGTPDLT